RRHRRRLPRPDAQLVAGEAADVDVVVLSPILRTDERLDREATHDPPGTCAIGEEAGGLGHGERLPVAEVVFAHMRLRCVVSSSPYPACAETEPAWAGAFGERAD